MNGKDARTIPQPELCHVGRFGTLVVRCNFQIRGALQPLTLENENNVEVQFPRVETIGDATNGVYSLNHIKGHVGNRGDVIDPHLQTADVFWVKMKQTLAVFILLINL